jgi:hypothetical protein
MVQGNVLALTTAHLLIAVQTGVVAGGIAFALGMLARIDEYLATPLLLGVCTAVVDYFVDPGSFGSVATEAVVTGFAIAAIAFGVALIVRYRRSRRTI